MFIHELSQKTVMVTIKKGLQLSRSHQSRIYTTHLHRHRIIYIAAFLAFVFMVYHRHVISIMGERFLHKSAARVSKPTQSIFLPYVRKYCSDEIPLVKTTVHGVDIDMPVDTGSTGLLLGAPLLPNIAPNEGIKTYHYLTSSTILYVGRLVDLSITFHGEQGSSAVAQVPALVVDESFKCPWYDSKRDKDKCPRGPNGEEAKRRDTSKITYMGVGFGRNKPGSGQPEATPGRNAFLNIVSINDTAVSQHSLRAGYTISTKGIRLGLTEDVMRGFLFASLEPGVMHKEDGRDWAMMRCNFSINGNGGGLGYGLIDTGVSQMYVRAEDGVSIPTIVIPNPDPNGMVDEVERVAPGTKIHVEFLSLDGSKVDEFKFSVEMGKSKMEPSYVKEGKQTPPPFVNTGRNFLFGYDIAYDAIGGRFGFRHIEDPLEVYDTVDNSTVSCSALRTSLL